jgi:hypothetical protein
MYSDLTEIAGYISIVSVATERVVEILKPLLPKPNPAYTTTMYSTLAWLISTSIISINAINLPLISSGLYTQAFVIGLACTAGSGFWNDILKALQTMKVK